MKYKIIISKDRKKYRHIKAFVNVSNAINCFKNLLLENEKIKFEKRYINYVPCEFHIELLSPKKYSDIIEWEKDKLGRNVEAPDRNGLYLWKLKSWKEPEYFTIYGLPDKYDYDFLHGLIKKTQEIIGMSMIQNILILDINGKPLIITLKNIPDAKRLYKVILSEEFKHVLPFGTMSKKNRKGFYKLVEEMGVPVKMFYTKSTRW